MKTNLQVLNEISAKLGGREDALVITEALNNIANALGDTEPDRISTVSESLTDILEYVGGGGGIDYVINEQTVEITDGDLPTIEVDDSNLEDEDFIFMKIVGNLGGEIADCYAIANYMQGVDDMEIYAYFEFYGTGFELIASKTDQQGIYTLNVLKDEETFPAIYTITACKAPF